MTVNQDFGFPRKSAGLGSAELGPAAAHQYSTNLSSSMLVSITWINLRVKLDCTARGGQSWAKSSCILQKKCCECGSRAAGGWIRAVRMLLSATFPVSPALEWPPKLGVHPRLRWFLSIPQLQCNRHVEQQGCSSRYPLGSGTSLMC